MGDAILALALAFGGDGVSTCSAPPSIVIGAGNDFSPGVLAVFALASLHGVTASPDDGAVRAGFGISIGSGCCCVSGSSGGSSGGRVIASVIW